MSGPRDRRGATDRPNRSRRWVPGLETLESRSTPAALYAVDVAPGSAPVVPVYDAGTQQQTLTINAYESTFTGGVDVAVADVNGDGTPDIITGAGPGGGPVVKVFSGTDGSLLGSFTVGDSTSTAGVTVAAGDFENTGKADIVVGTMQGGQPLVEILRFADQSVVKSFTPFAGASGVSVAVGDVNGDGTPDVIAGSGSGIASQVIVYSGTDGSQLQTQTPFEPTFTGGTSVAAGDLNGDAKADVIVAAGPGGGPRVEVYSGADGSLFQNFFAYDSTQRAGALATAFDSSGSVALVTTDGPGQTPTPETFDPQTLAPLAAPSVPYLPAGTAYDVAAPTATVSSTTSSPTNLAAIPVTITFNKAVEGFTAAGVTVTNGTASNFTAASGTTYTMDVTPTADGVVTVSVPAGAATDAAGAANTASNTFSITSSRAAPVATITSTATSPTNADPIPVTVTFDQDVTGFSAAGVTATNGTVSNFTAVSGTVYTFDVTPTADGTVTVFVAASSATNSAGNGNAAATYTITSTRTAPTVTVASTATSPTNTSPIPVTVTFGSAVTGFSAAGVTVTNGTASNFTATSGTTYTFDVTPAADGAVTVSVPAGAATDAAGNASTASNTLSVTSDATPPGVTIDPTPAAAGAVTGTASDATSGVAAVAVSISNGSAYWDGSGFNSTTPQFLPATTTNNYATWTYAFTGPPGSYTVQAQATDAAGNKAQSTATVTTT